MKSLGRLILASVIALLTVLPVAAPAAAQSDVWVPPAGCESGTFTDTGAKWVVCMPGRLGKSWNGDLVIFAHGYVNPIPDRAPELPGGQYALRNADSSSTQIPDMVNNLNYAFATTSYRTNGLAVKDGVADVVQVADFFRANHWSLFPHTYVVGASEGGLVTAKAIEQQPSKFSGGIAACGPVGDFLKQTNYLGDFRVIFDYLYPRTDGLHLLPPSAIDVPPDLYNNWDTGLNFQAQVANAIGADAAKASQLLTVTGAPGDATAAPEVAGSAVDTAKQILWYDVFATNDARVKLGGNPYDNARRKYTGSDNDQLLNAKVDRYKAVKVATSNISKYYQTTGHLTRALALLHNTGDPVVPYWHETLYKQRVGANSNYKLYAFDRYGHCNFESSEIMAAFQWVVIHSGGFLFAAPRDALPSPDEYQRFLDLTRDLRK